MSVKADNYLRPFRGRGDDFEVFWEKFLVLCTLQKQDTDIKKMSVLPLFLYGDAFQVFTQMSADDQKKPDEVQKRLQGAFSMTRAQAYRLFSDRVLREDESADAYVADLKRLLALSGHPVKDSKDQILVEQLIRGLPVDFARQVRLALAGKEAEVVVIVDQIRALRACEADCRQVRQATVAVVGGDDRTARDRGSGVICFKCGQSGHYQRNCRSKSGARPAQRSDNKLVCYFCDGVGHTKTRCPERAAWLKSREKPAAALKSCNAGKKPLCSTVGEAGSGELPRVVVDVRSGAGDAWTSTVAAIDTCSSCTLMEEQLVMSLQYDIVPHQEVLVAIDGQRFRSLGYVDLDVQRNGEAVHMPEVRAKVLVVESLAVVNAPMIVGIDLISVVGGVHMTYDDDGDLSKVVFGRQATDSTRPVVASVSEQPKVSRHTTVTHTGVDGDVVLTFDDAEVTWKADAGYWEMKWNWEDGIPQSFIGSGVAEYSRRKLTPEQEQMFCDAVDEWISNGWLVRHDVTQHGEPMCVLPFMAIAQEHKASTPVRPVLDYRELNRHIKSRPGFEAPVCGEKLRQWRQAGDAHEFKMVDIRKAYLQIRVDPGLAAFQVVKWKGILYVMTRMAFGLNVAPKVMDTVVRYVTRDHRDVDNFVDDIMVPSILADAVTENLAKYGLPTKPSEEMCEGRVLGLQLFDRDGQVMWRRRDGIDTTYAQPLTKREVYRWCGRLTSHYPVCHWLRPACCFLKRLASKESSWDKPVSPELAACCDEVVSRLATDDPVAGVWQARSSEESMWTVWCDASDVATGVVLENSSGVVEDRCWLRKEDDKRHINVMELEAIIKGLSLASDWHAKSVMIMTDSKTVHSWVSNVLFNVRRVKVGGLYDVLVQRRLQIIEDMVALSSLHVELTWVPSQQNKSDVLTRVPESFTRLYKSRRLASPPSSDPVVAAAGQVHTDVNTTELLKMADIIRHQADDASIATVVQSIVAGVPITVPEYVKVREQLILDQGVLYRNVKVPPNDIHHVPVIPAALEEQIVRRAHEITGHANWEAVWKFLREQCFFPCMSAVCQRHVTLCNVCAAANSRRGQCAEPSRPVTPSGPWNVVQLDTLELGYSRSKEFHCVLVCTDMFTKWAEVVPLRRHDGESVAQAFVNVCCRWGPPQVVRCDNGSELYNTVTKALHDAFGVDIRRGAVRHPQSQGAVERFNRTLLTLIRKVLAESDDWMTSLDLLLFYYRIRPHSATGISPMQAMSGWQPQSLLVEQDCPVRSLSAWTDALRAQAARVRDYVEEELSKVDFIEHVGVCPYNVGDRVLLRRDHRHQKRLAAYESGWLVVKVVSPSTVHIQRTTGAIRASVKVVNVDLLKIDACQREPDVNVASDDSVAAAYDQLPDDDAAADNQLPVDADTDAFGLALDFELLPAAPPVAPPVAPALPVNVGGHALRTRDAIGRPSRYTA